MSTIAQCSALGGISGVVGSSCEGQQAFCTGTGCIMADTACHSGAPSGATCDIDPLNPNRDNDGISDACDNCPFDYNPMQSDLDNDGVGDVCDNCDSIANPANIVETDCNGNQVIDTMYGEGIGQQCDQDLDGRGDACDNCPNNQNVFQEDSDAHCSITTGVLCGPPPGGGAEYLGSVVCPQGETCVSDTTFANGYFGYGDACDNCLGIADPDQGDCDGNGEGDVCDGDIDGDSVANADDLCDFTPGGVQIDTNATSQFLGTTGADLDGDCDVDGADLLILQKALDPTAVLDPTFGIEGCKNGSPVSEVCSLATP